MMTTESRDPKLPASPVNRVLGVIPLLALVAVVVFVGRSFFESGGGGRPADPKPPAVAQPFGGSTLRGSATASVGIIEYAEYQCPYCARFATDLFPKLDETYIKTGQVSFAFRHFPLEKIHPFAFDAARVSVCVSNQGHFWDLHERLLSNQALLDATYPSRVAAQIGINTTALNNCLANDAATQVRQDLESAKILGLFSTPSFLVGRVKDGKLFVTSVIVGFKPFGEFAAAIEKAKRSGD